MMFNEIRRLPEFVKDLKKLSKKYKTLEDDIKVFEDTALKMYHHLNVKHDGILPIANLGILYPTIYKVKKFACKALKGKGVQSGIRITYAYHSNENIIEHIEIYHKSDKDNEDKKRIIQYYKK
jgi:mRNA-degrading endonuclease RelE of RelBE toxin-antitoxin system